MWRSLRRWWLRWQKPKMTGKLQEFNERMLFQTQRVTHTQFMQSLSPDEARAYLDAFDLWLVGKNPQATDQDYYWRSLLMRYFFPDLQQEKADLKCAVALAPGNVDIWVSLGHMAADRKQWNEAIAYYEGGIKASPGNFFPWYGRAGVYKELRRFEQALKDIETAIEIHPHLAYGHEMRGQIHHKMGELEEALADLEVAMECNGAGPSTQRFRDELRNILKQTKVDRNPPPPTLDGARVLWWAWSGRIPFGELPGADGDDRLIHGFAVCRYDRGKHYRFTCNKHWEVVQDADHNDENQAKASIPIQYDARRVKWRRYVDEYEDPPTIP